MIIIFNKLRLQKRLRPVLKFNKYFSEIRIKIGLANCVIIANKYTYKSNWEPTSFFEVGYKRWSIPNKSKYSLLK